MRVHVDMDLCQSNGECCFAAPEVFELDDDDILQYDAAPSEELRAKVEEAVSVCPVTAIAIVE
jgi:ferredoxin